MPRPVGLQVRLGEKPVDNLFSLGGDKYYVRKRINKKEFRRDFIAATPTEARDIRDEILDPRERRKLAATDRSIKLDTFYQQLMKRSEEAAKRGLRPGLRTLQTYRERYETNIAPVLGNPKLADIDANDISDVYDVMRMEGYVDQNGKQQDYSEGTLTHVRSTFNWIFNAAISSDFNLRPDNPTKKVGLSKPRPKSQEIQTHQVFQDAEYEALIAKTRDMIKKAAFIFGRETGLRLREVLGMRLTNLYFLQDEILVDAQLTDYRLTEDVSYDERLGSNGYGRAGHYGLRPLKGDTWWNSAHVRKIDMSDTLKSFLLDEYLPWLKREGLHGEWLFPNRKNFGPVCPFGFGRAFRGTLKQAGIQRAGLTPHALRHTYATVAFNDGLEVEHIAYNLGHLDGGVITRKVYAKFMPTKSRKQAFREAQERRHLRSVGQ